MYAIYALFDVLLLAEETLAEGAEKQSIMDFEWQLS